METVLEIPVKIMAEGERLCFPSLADALKAFLFGHVGQLRLLGDVSFEVRRTKIEINERKVDFGGLFNQVPTASLRVLGWDEKMSDIPNFGSLAEGFEAFWQRRIKGLQIYEQETRGDPTILLVHTNCMVIFSWEEGDFQQILFKLRNAAIKDGPYYWGEKFIPFHIEGKRILFPIFGAKHKIVNIGSKN